MALIQQVSISVSFFLPVGFLRFAGELMASAHGLAEAAEEAVPKGKKGRPREEGEVTEERARVKGDFSSREEHYQPFHLIFFMHVLKPFYLEWSPGKGENPSGLSPEKIVYLND